MKIVRIGPQGEKQRMFLASPADITLYGGAAGGGKTWALLFSPLRHIKRPDFTGVLFRRTTQDIRKPGSLWDESMKLYPGFTGRPRDSFLDWYFKSGAYIKLAGLEHEKDVLTWKGAQIPYIAFDQVETFTRHQFFYMMSRNRSLTGIRGYMHATCNPDPDSWVASFIAWWIDQLTGLPIEERAGVLRWFTQQNDVIVWADTPHELIEKYPGSEPKSVTFIPAKLEDNQILMEKDPGYRANLLNQSLVEQERLLHGNWKIRPAAGLLFRREWCTPFDAVPDDIQSVVRRWDLAGTLKLDSNDPDWTVGIKLGRRPLGVKPRYVMLDAIRMRVDPGDVKTAIINTAIADGHDVKVILPQDPGQAGKFQLRDMRLALDGYTCAGQLESGDKITRFNPFSAQCHNGNVGYVKGPWNEPFFIALEAFPDPLAHDDDADACSGAYMSFVDTSSGMLDYFATLAADKATADAEREKR